MGGLPPLPSTLAVFKTVQGTSPAAGAEMSQAVPTGKWWIPYAVSIPLVQGLTQTPQPILVLDDGTNTFWECLGCSAAQAASTTCQYTWAASIPGITGQLGSGASIHAQAPLPADLVLPAGFRIRTVTLGIGANSDYGTPTLFVCELG